MKLAHYQKAHQRSPQRTLFDANQRIAPTVRWHEGARIDYLGSSLSLQLDTDRRQALREDDVLHLPLPPDATERQIQDAAESWLRREAKTLFSELIANQIVNQTQRLKQQNPTFSLSFSLKGSWAQLDGGVLRLNWRLIEQPLSVIELTLRRAIAMLPAEQTSNDLFAAFSS
jgi:predicted metal-dependent hydrolase